MAIEPRFYRGNFNTERFRFFPVVLNETDLWIGVNQESYHPSMPGFCYERVKHYRMEIVNCIDVCPRFATSHSPLDLSDLFPPIALKMAEAAKSASTGPMAAVAGAMADFVGADMITRFKPEELIIENGGDILASVKRELLVQFYAGDNMHFNKLALRITPEYPSLGICTSSGKFGHSFSYGTADSVSIVCRSATLADAWATSVCNQIKTKNDVAIITEKYKNVPEILSMIIVKEDAFGVFGKFELQNI